MPVLPAPCYVISDAHLGVTPPEVEPRLRRFLGDLDGRAGSLIINGDLFDFWFAWRRVMPRVGFRVLALLASLAERGLPVVWIAGNHDCWGGDVLRSEVGVDYHLGEWRGQAAGWQTRVAHGDGLRGVEDAGYRRLRSVLRNPLAIRAFRLLHPDLATRIALGSSDASRRYRARDGGDGLRHVAHEALRAEPTLELVIFAHAHVPALERVAGGGVYANAGTWMDDTTFLRIDEDAVHLLRWHGPGEEELLGSETRAAVTNAR